MTQANREQDEIKLADKKQEDKKAQELKDAANAPAGPPKVTAPAETKDKKSAADSKTKPKAGAGAAPEKKEGGSLLAAGENQATKDAQAYAEAIWAFYKSGEVGKNFWKGIGVIAAVPVVVGATAVTGLGVGVTSAVMTAGVVAASPLVGLGIAAYKGIQYLQAQKPGPAEPEGVELADVNKQQPGATANAPERKEPSAPFLARTEEPPGPIPPDGPTPSAEQTPLALTLAADSSPASPSNSVHLPEDKTVDAQSNNAPQPAITPTPTPIEEKPDGPAGP